MMFDKLNGKYTMINTKFGGSVMATDAQVRANRLNAAKSTGPRTAEGKAAVSQNAVKHGLRAEQAVIRGEDPGEFEFYRDRMLGELAPVGVVESVLAERAVGLAWRLKRAERVQNEVFDTLYTDQTADPLAKLTQSLLAKRIPRPPGGADDRDLTLGQVVARDFANSRVLDRLLMYERRMEHSLYKTLAELQKLRLMRELDQPTRSAGDDTAGGSGLPRRSATRDDRDTGEEELRQTKPISANDDAQTPPRDPVTADKGGSFLTTPVGFGIIPRFARAGEPPIRHVALRSE
jgi:hypothetical protein